MDDKSQDGIGIGLFPGQCFAKDPNGVFDQANQREMEYTQLIC